MYLKHLLFILFLALLSFLPASALLIGKWQVELQWEGQDEIIEEVWYIVPFVPSLLFEAGFVDKDGDGNHDYFYIHLPLFGFFWSRGPQKTFSGRVLDDFFPDSLMYGIVSKPKRKGLWEALLVF